MSAGEASTIVPRIVDNLKSAGLLNKSVSGTVTQVNEELTKLNLHIPKTYLNVVVSQHVKKHLPTTNPPSPSTSTHHPPSPCTHQPGQPAIPPLYIHPGCAHQPAIPPLHMHQPAMLPSAYTHQPAFQLPSSTGLEPWPFLLLSMALSLKQLVNIVAKSNSIL